jgi:hypothetical protein
MGEDGRASARLPGLARASSRGGVGAGRPRALLCGACCCDRRPDGPRPAARQAADYSRVGYGKPLERCTRWVIVEGDRAHTGPMASWLALRPAMLAEETLKALLAGWADRGTRPRPMNVGVGELAIVARRLVARGDDVPGGCGRVGEGSIGVAVTSRSRVAGDPELPLWDHGEALDHGRPRGGRGGTLGDALCWGGFRGRYRLGLLSLLPEDANEETVKQHLDPFGFVRIRRKVADRVGGQCCDALDHCCAICADQRRAGCQPMVRCEESRRPCRPPSEDVAATKFSSPRVSMRGSISKLSCGAGKAGNRSQRVKPRRGTLARGTNDSAVDVCKRSGVLP